MAREGPGVDRGLTFSQVELRGLEPLTPCLQSKAKLSSTVCGLARRLCWFRLSTAVSSRVGVGYGCQRGPASRRLKQADGWSLDGHKMFVIDGHLADCIASVPKR